MARLRYNARPEVPSCRAIPFIISCAAAADYLLTLTIRALDYTPPIDLRCARRASTQGTA